MSNEKFKIGDKVSRRKNDGCFVGSPTSTVVVAEPDDTGYIVVKNDGEYFTVLQDDYEVLPKRYVVERRAPKDGETYFRLDIDPIVAETYGDSGYQPYLVVMEVLS